MARGHCRSCLPNALRWEDAAAPLSTSGGNTTKPRFRRGLPGEALRVRISRSLVRRGPLDERSGGTRARRPDKSLGSADQRLRDISTIGADGEERLDQQIDRDGGSSRLHLRHTRLTRVQLLRKRGLREMCLEPHFAQPSSEAYYPPEGRALKDAIAAVDAVLFVTPEYNRSIPGALKNAIDWASRPWGKNSFARKPSAVIGTSPGKIGTAVGQQHVRSIMAFCNSPMFNAIEAYIEFTPNLIEDDGEVTSDSTRDFLASFMTEFHGYITRVYTAIPRTSGVVRTEVSTEARAD